MPVLRSGAWVGIGQILLLAVLLALNPGCGRNAIRRVPVPARSTPSTPSPIEQTPDEQPESRPSEAGAASAADPRRAPAEGHSTPPDKAPVKPAARPPVDPVALSARRVFAGVTVREPASLSRPAEALTFGLPLARGVLHEVDSLRAWQAREGQALPIQARALSRWPDDSLRWVLVDTLVDLTPEQQLAVAVGQAEDLQPSSDPWQLTQLPEGGLAASDGTTVWTLWQSGAGPALDRVAGLSSTLTDRFGLLYDGVIEPESAVLLERGPLRLCFSISGAHRSRDGLGLEIDFHRFTAVVHLMAGTHTARVEWSLSNGPLEQPPGRLAFRAYDLRIDVAETLRVVLLEKRMLRDEGAAVLTQVGNDSRLTVGGSSVPAPRPGDLWMGVHGLESDLFVQRVESAQNHPTGLACGPTGPLTVRLLPTLPGREYYLDDATRKTFRMHLVRNAGKAGPARVQRLIDPAHVALDPVQVAASGAWGDAGQLFVPDARELSSRASPPADAPTGWVDWGEAEAHNTHQSGSPRNRLSVFLEAVQSGRADLFRWAQSRAWHAMDLRPYHIDGFLAAQHPDANLYEGIPHSNEQPHRRLGRSEMDQRFPEYKQGLPSQGHGYNGFDPEHMTLDDVYECWLLTGSWQALDALRSAGEAMLTWKEVIPSGSIHSSRTFGWTLRALVQVYRATGEARYLAAAARLVARADAERGQGSVRYLRRMPPDGRHIADQESDSPWMVAIALHGLAAYWLESADPIVPPMAADLSDFCMAAFRGNGFLPDLPLDAPVVGGSVDSLLGVTSWVPGGLAAAAFITGDHSAVDRTRGYYAQLRRHSKQPVSFGGQDWHWWQAWLVSVSERHGRDAL
jgi:hypothetical protein